MSGSPLAQSMQELMGWGPLGFWNFVAAFAVLFLFALPFGGAAVYVERKMAADFQDRIGPNRVGPLGLLQIFADLIKMVAKEDSLPTGRDPFLFQIAPVLLLIGVLGAFAVTPFSRSFLPADLDIGVLYVLGITALVPTALLIGAWASNNKWSLLGGLRAAGQIISYEVPVALCLLIPVLLTGHAQLGKIVEEQAAMGWLIWHNPFTPLAALLLYVGGLAEANRIPFDLPEAESELVAGFNTEYSGIRFGLFALGEFCEVFITSSLLVALYFGGWHLPLVPIERLLPNASWLPIALLHTGTFLSKTFALVFLAMWIRWTLPRFRADQMMRLCWKVLTPLALLSLLGSALWMQFSHGRSLFQWVFR